MNAIESQTGKLPHPRRGMALLLVLLLLSLTVGLCYAAMRSQFTAATIQRNSDRMASARQAAVTGMTMAVKKMSRNDWSGVGTSLNGSLGTYESFLATFTPGDAKLSVDDADQPYRVTLLSTGYAVDPEHPQSIAAYRVRAVVRLIPRKLAAQPSDWTPMKGYTVYQTRKEDTEIDIPCRFTGKVRLQKKLKLALHYPNDNDARSRYMSDLNQMRLAGRPDYRTFNGPVYLPYSEQESQYYTLLTSKLGVTAIDAPAVEAVTNWIKPTSLTSYRIYPGGPAYTVQPVSSSLQNAALQPDPQSNPLGLFYRDGGVTIYNNVTINGSLFCKDDLQINGTNIVIRAVGLPPLAGSTAAVRLATTSSQNTTVGAGGGGQITGLAAVFNSFKIEKGSENMTFSLAGQLATHKLYVEEREPWNILNWGTYYNLFILQLYLNPPTAVQYFPEYMSNYGRNPAPRLVFAPETSEVTYHWANSYDPIFVPHPDDGGLRWDLLTWSEEQ